MTTARSPQDERGRNLGLIMELDVAVSLLESGLALLQRSRLYNTRHFAFLLLLASGLERLMKVIVILHVLHTEGRFPTQQEHKKIGHDLQKLLAQVIARCFTSDYLRRPVAQEDLEFLMHDATLAEMLSILSDFACSDRYIFLDLTATPTPTIESPDRRWDSLEMRQLTTADFHALAEGQGADDVKARMVHDQVVMLERLIRALSRLFALADLGLDGRKLSMTVGTFARLDDDALGMTRYQI